MQLVARHEEEHGVTVLLLHPGTVTTERIESTPESIDMTRSVSGMIEQIAKATVRDTGRFIAYDGTTVPW